MNETDAARRCVDITRAVELLESTASTLRRERRGLILGLIRQHGWSQHDVARHLGISQPAVGKIVGRAV